MSSAAGSPFGVPAANGRRGFPALKIPLYKNTFRTKENCAMARITVEDCLENVSNRFELVLLAARRTKQLLKGARPLVETDNKEIVAALREIGEGKVRISYPEIEES